MHLFTHALKSGRGPVKAACESLGRDFPSFTRHAIVIGVPVPQALRPLHGYAMCLNHWLRFLPVPVILLNARWFADDERLRERYARDVASGYHPDCGCPFRYVLAHEIAHFIYGRIALEDRKKWESIFEPGKPSGYSTTAEEGFCEAFAGNDGLARALARAGAH